MQCLPIASGHGLMIRDPMPRPGRRRRPEVGQRISAAKKGKPLVARGQNEITRQEAVRETGLSAKVLLEGADRQLRFERGEHVRPGLRHRRLRHANGGDVILFDRRELAEDLAHPDNRCVYPGCDQPAPGTSQRCGKHKAKGEAPVSLVCEYDECPREGKPFLRHASTHRARVERGDKHTFCGETCQMLWQRENDAIGSPHAPFTADSARERYEGLAPAFDEARTELALPLTVHQLAEVTHTSPAVIRIHAPELCGQKIEINGKQELAFPADAEERYPRLWASKANVSDEQWKADRARYFDPDWMVRQQARTIALLCDRGLTRAQAEAAVHANAAERRTKFIRRRTGRPARGAVPAHHTRWLERFLEMHEYYERRACAGEEMPSLWSLHLIVAREDFADHPEDWSYDPDTMPREAADRVRKAIKPLLTERKETSRS